MMRRRAGGWAKDILLLGAALGLMAGIGFGFAEIMERGRPGREAFGRELQRTFADAVEASIRAGSDVEEDPVIIALVETMRERLEAGLPGVTKEYAVLPEIRILVVNSESVNALAFPGNLVVLYTGLIRIMDGPEVLAGVLAHEIGHCVTNDARNALIRELGISVVLGASGAGSAGELAGEAVRGAVQMRYGRRAEERADRFAVDLLAASGLNPLAFSRALESLGEAVGEMPEWMEHVDVHPPLRRRIADAKRRAGAGGTGAEYDALSVDWDRVLEALDLLS